MTEKILPGGNGFDLSPIPGCITDAGGKILIANRAMRRMVRKSAASLKGKSLTQVLPKSFRPTLQAQIRSKKGKREFVLRSEEPKEGVFRGMAVKLGRQQEYLWHFIPEPAKPLFADPSIELMVQTSQYSRHAIVVLDHSLKVQYCNKACRFLWVFNKSRLKSRSYRALFIKPFLPSLEKALQRARSGEWQRFEASAQLNSEDSRWAGCVIAPLIREGAVASIMLFFQDVTERKRAEQMIRMSRNIYDQLFKKITIGIIIIGKDRVLYVNPAMRKMFGGAIPTDTGEMLERSKNYPQNLKLWQNSQQRLRGRKLPERYEYEIVTKNHERRLLEVNSQVIEVDHQPQVVTTMVDITRFRQHEQLLRERASEQALINDIAKVCNQSLELKKISSAALKALIKAVGAYFGTLLLLDQDGRTLIPIRSVGLNRKEHDVLFPLKFPLEVTPRSIAENKPIWITDVRSGHYYPPLLKLDITSFAIIPLLSEGRQMGAINLAARGENKMRMMPDEVLLAIGNQIGMALDNARLLKEREIEIRERQKAEQALRQSESLYKNVIDMSPDALALINSKGRVLLVNQRMAELFGYDSVEEIIARKRSILQLFPSADRIHARQIGLQIMEQGVLRQRTDVMRRRDGSTFVAEWSAVAIRDYDNFVNVSLGTFQDVTERRIFEENLRKSEERYRTLAEAAHDMIFIIDRDDRVVYVNTFAASQFGRKPEELINLNRAQLFPPEINVEQQEALDQVIRTGEPFYAESVSLFNGREVWLGSWLAPLFDVNNQVNQVLGVSRDITEIKRTEAALKESEQRSRDIIERSLDGYYFIDPNGIILNINRALAEMAGLTPAKLIGVDGLQMGDEDTIRRAKKVMAQVLGGRNINWDEHASTSADGQKRWFGYSARRVMKNGIVVGIEGFVKDISHQALTRERLRILSKRLVEVQEEERARISREIHDSLGQYLAALQLSITAAVQASGGQVPESLLEAQRTVRESIQIASTLCYTLRPPLLDDFGLIAALRDYLREFEQRWQIPIHFHETEINGLLNQEAETALFRVAQEALTNVLKHAQATRIEIDIQVSDHNVVMAIGDNGRGFNYQEIEKPFRLDRFGLITMKERIGLLGGKFQLMTTPGKGTRIIVHIPVHSKAGDETDHRSIN